MSELEKMGRNLMDIALQYTHPNFEGMYPDWGAVCNIGEELVRMSKPPKLYNNQKQVLEWLKTGHCDGDSVFESLERITYVYEDPKTEEALESLSPDQEVQVISSFMKWALGQGGEK